MDSDKVVSWKGGDGRDLLDDGDGGGETTLLTSTVTTAESVRRSMVLAALRSGRAKREAMEVNFMIALSLTG